nr:exopolysaccharide biosynthesis protein [Pseudohoeflea sp. DP4N28-3]
MSELLDRLADTPGDQVSIRQIAGALEDRSFGAFLLVFAIPNLIPLPPGATLILGLPMVFIAWQIVAGYPKVWLPRFLADTSIEKKRFRAMVDKVIPWLGRSERWVRPRRWPINGTVRERLFGLFALVLAIVCVLPIPFGNWLPAFAVGVLGVAHTERDGICLAAGFAVGIVSIALAGIVVLATGALLMSIF